MAMVEMNAFEDLCRFCATKIDIMMGINLFAPDQRDLLKKVNTCLPVKISATDGFPKIICMECAYKLDVTFEFRERCLLTAHLFEEMITADDMRSVLILPETDNADSVLLEATDFQSFKLDVDESKYHSNDLMPPMVVEVAVHPDDKPKLLQSEDVILEEAATYKTENFTIEVPSNSSDLASIEPKPCPRAKRKSEKTDQKTCGDCGKVCSTNSKLQEHMRRHTGERPFTCSYETCKKSFRSKIGLAQHEASHSGRFELQCVTCGKGFQCKSYLVVHQRVHSDAKPFPCQQCPRTFKTKQSLHDHVNRHLGVKPFLCDICGRGFITKGLCKSHQKVHSGKDNRQYPCHVCRKLFVSKSYLNTHFRIHSGEKPYMCEVCGKGFVTRVDLRIHSTLHTGEKKFVCETCGKPFARRDALRCHRRSHTGERPYKCEYCGQSFTQFSPMAIHKRLHTGERPYKCEICSKSFVSKSSMLTHCKKLHITDGNQKTSVTNDAASKDETISIKKNKEKLFTLDDT